MLRSLVTVTLKKLSNVTQRLSAVERVETAEGGLIDVSTETHSVTASILQ